MIKRTFNYCATHKEDEEYMAQMCSQGWAATKLVEGFWTFEKCEPNHYFYRICYLRDINKNEFEKFKKQYKENGIEFVSRYSFWAIFRSEKEFELYSKEEELEVCKKIFKPMPIGSIVSWILFFLGAVLTHNISNFIIIPTVIIGIYASVCSWLTIEYNDLLKNMKSNKS